MANNGIGGVLNVMICGLFEEITYTTETGQTRFTLFKGKGDQLRADAERSIRRRNTYNTYPGLNKGTSNQSVDSALDRCQDRTGLILDSSPLDCSSRCRLEVVLLQDTSPYVNCT
jgi:hypothetical protein